MVNSAIEPTLEGMQEKNPKQRPCEHQGCPEDGLYPAPQSKLKPKPYLWFCKTHVRAYNEQWDWYHGMTAAQIVDDQIADLTWRRPTFAMKDGVHRAQTNVVLDDPLQILYRIISTDAAGSKDKTSRHAAAPDAVFVMGTTTVAALKTLGLENPVNLAMVKENYRRAALRLHPDKIKTTSKKLIMQKTEEFQKISAAYQELKKYFLQNAR